MKRHLIAIASVFLAAVFLAGSSFAFGEKKSHMSKEKNPLECSSCHSGKGMPGTPLLKAAPDRLCFECHGVFGRGKSKSDIESVFAKRSIHPIYDTAKFHVKGEELPEKVSATPRHVACDDCHKAHNSSPSVPWAGVKGYSSARAKMKIANEEYELCYLCHSDSANLPSSQKNKRDEFDPYNESYHPVELAGRNKYVPSLVRGLNVNSRIRCTDCHGNNDVNGPRGPHGSDYPPLLAAQYTTTDGIESPKAYELCYMCHDRRSILGNESFKKHNLHIVSQGASCYTCHTSHGSANNKSLIAFNPSVVSPSNTGAGPEYIEGLPQTKCYLKCHSADHQALGVFGSDGLKMPGGW